MRPKAKPAMWLPAVRLSATRAVGLSLILAAVVLCVFVYRHVSRVPMFDEYCSIQYLFSDAKFDLAWYWGQHNEHRIPVPRALYFAAVRLAGYDFRAPPVLNVLLLIAASAFFLRSIRRVRREFRWSDAAIPLGLLSVGQYENLLWGFQVQFIASTALSLTALGLVLEPGIAQSPRRLAALSACGVLLVGCGANGVAFAPGIAVGLFVAALAGRFSPVRNRPAAVVGLLGGIAILSITAAYFSGLQKPPHHEHAGGTLLETAIGSVNLLGASFGPVVRWLPPQPYSGVTILGVIAVLLVAATTTLLLSAAYDPARRVHALVIGGVLVGFLGLAVGIAKSRSGLTNVLDVNRYVSLMLPMLAGIYGAWVAFGFARLPGILAVVVALFAVPNAIIGWHDAKLQSFLARDIERQVRSGMPLEFVADRNFVLFRGQSEFRRISLEEMRRNGVVPFNGATPIPLLVETEVPLRMLRIENAVPEEGGFRTIGESGHAVYALPRRQCVYGFKLTYSAVAGANPALPSAMSWEADGARPTRPETMVLYQLEPRPVPTETLIWVQGEADSLRIDLFGEGARITVHRLVVLTRPE